MIEVVEPVNELLLLKLLKLDLHFVIVVVLISIYFSHINLVCLNERHTACVPGRTFSIVTLLKADYIMLLFETV